MSSKAAGAATRWLQTMVDEHTALYRERHGHPWRYEGAVVRRDGKTYFLVAGGIHYFLNTRQHAQAHLASYLETGKAHDSMRRIGRPAPTDETLPCAVLTERDMTKLTAFKAASAARLDGYRAGCEDWEMEALSEREMNAAYEVAWSLCEQLNIEAEAAPALSVRCVNCGGTRTYRRPYANGVPARWHCRACECDFDPLTDETPLDSSFQIPAPDSAPNLTVGETARAVSEMEFPRNSHGDHPEICPGCGRWGTCSPRCDAPTLTDGNMARAHDSARRCVEDAIDCPNEGWPVPCPRCGFCRQNPADFAPIIASDPHTDQTPVLPMPAVPDEWHEAATEEHLACQGGGDSGHTFDDWEDDDDDWEDEYYSGFYVPDDDDDDQENLGLVAVFCAVCGTELQFLPSQPAATAETYTCYQCTRDSLNSSKWGLDSLYVERPDND